MVVSTSRSSVDTRYLDVASNRKRSPTPSNVLDSLVLTAKTRQAVLSLRQPSKIETIRCMTAELGAPSSSRVGDPMLELPHGRYGVGAYFSWPHRMLTTPDSQCAHSKRNGTTCSVLSNYMNTEWKIMPRLLDNYPRPTFGSPWLPLTDRKPAFEVFVFSQLWTNARNKPHIHTL